MYERYRPRRLLDRPLEGGILRGPFESIRADASSSYARPSRPIPTDWEALTFQSGVDIYGAIGDMNTRAGLSIGFSVETAARFPQLTTYDAIDRHWNVPPWLNGWAHWTYEPLTGYGTAGVRQADFIRYVGPAKQLAFDGDDSLAYDLSSAYLVDSDNDGDEDDPYEFVLDVGETVAFFVYGQWNQLNAAEVMLSFYSSVDATDEVVLRKTGTNTVQGLAFVNNAAVGGGANPDHDFDVAEDGGIGTKGWLLLELIVGGGGNITMRVRSFFAGKNVSATQAIGAGSFPTKLNRVRLGARGADSSFLRGKIERVVGVRSAVAESEWDAVRAGGRDPFTMYPRASRLFDPPLRDPFGLRDRYTGLLPISTTGAPVLEAGTATSVVNCLYPGAVTPGNYTALAGQTYMSNSDGLWKCFPLPTGYPEYPDPADTLSFAFGPDPAVDINSQPVSSNEPSYIIGCGRPKGAVISDGSGKFYLVPLLAGI